VQRCFSSDIYACIGNRLGVGSFGVDSHHWPTGSGLEFFAKAGDSDAKRSERAGAARLTHGRTHLAAAAAHKLAVVVLRYGCLACFAALHRSTAAAGQQPGAACCIEHAHHLPLRVAEMAYERRRREAALPWFFTRAIDDLDNGPASAFVAYGRPKHVVDADRRNCCGTWARRHEHDWHTRSTSSLAGNVSGMPRGLAFVLQTFVVLVEYNDRGNAGTRRPHSGSCADHNIDSAGRRGPFIGKHGNSASSAS